MAGDAGDAGQNGTAGGVATGEGQEQQAGAQPDWSQITGTLSQMQSSQEEMRQLLAAEPWQAAAEPEPEGEPDLSWMEQAQFMSPEDQQAALAQTINERVQSGIEKAIGPVQQQIEAQRIQSEAAALVQEFPDLAQPENANKMFENARLLAEAQAPPEIAAHLIQQPWFWRLSHLALGGMEARQREGGAGAPPAGHMEGGGGAAPAAASQGQDLAAQLVSASQGGASVLPFR